MNNRVLILLFLLAASFVLAACSDEPYGSLICPPGSRDTLVVYPRLEFQQITVTSDKYSYDRGNDSGMAGMQSLYLGSSRETRSDILVNFDFYDFRWGVPGYPDSLFDVEHIRSVYLILKRLIPYSAYPDTGEVEPPTTAIIYNVRPLDTPFDPQNYQSWPGPVPSMGGQILNQDFQDLNHSDEPRLRMYTEDLVDWVMNGEKVGMAITAAEGSEPGLVGFASRELTRYNELPPLMVGSAVAPTIVVQFNDRTLPNLLIPPINDTSTFDQVAPLPPELVHIQTGLRSYPVLAFDIPPIPSGACIDKLGFRVSPVTTSPLWENDCLYLTYMDSTRYDWSGGSIMEGAFWDRRLFQVCPGPQATDGYFGSGPEVGYVGPLPEVMHLMFNFPDPTIYYWAAGGNADIYFSQSTFHGPDAAPDLRPALMIITGQREE